MQKNTLDRLMQKVLKLPSGCWLWMGAIQGKYYQRENGGYASIRYHGKVIPGHRLFYELLRGKIPEGMHIDHLCRITSCVNPDHMEVVTNRENWERGIRNKGESNLEKTHCPKGHEYSEENTVMLKDYKKGTMYRACHLCRKETYRKHDEKRGRRKAK